MTGKLMCQWCRKKECPPGRLSSCSDECWRKLRDANRKLEKLEAKLPKEDLGGIGS